LSLRGRFLCPPLALAGLALAAALQSCAPTVGEQWAIASGQVSEAGTAAPIDNAFVVLAGHEVYSDEDGSFFIERIPVPEDPESVVTVSRDRFRTFDAAFRFDAPGDLQVQLQPVSNPAASGTLDGTVRNDVTEEGIQGAEVTVRVESGIQVLDEQTAHTSMQGNWQVSGIPIGEVVVEAVADGFLPASETVNILAGRASNPLVVLDLTEGTSKVEVAGRVFDVESREPIADAVITDDREEATATSDADGNFVLTDVLVGQRTFRANADGYDPSFVTTLILADPDPLTIGMAKASGDPPPSPGTIAGTVTLAGAESPEGVRVILKDGASGATIDALDTDETGAFAFLVGPGGYSLTFLVDGYEPVTLEVDLEFGIPQRDIAVTLEPVG
jgi:hypothetical protein